MTIGHSDIYSETMGTNIDAAQTTLPPLGRELERGLLPTSKAVSGAADALMAEG
jgi:hypothetical protein